MSAESSEGAASIRAVRLRALLGCVGVRAVHLE